MNRGLQYALLALLGALLGVGGYFIFNMKRPSQQNTVCTGGQCYTQDKDWEQKNRQLFEKMGVKYLKHVDVVAPIVKEINVRNTEQYLKNPKYYDSLSRKYGNLIGKGYVAPCSVRHINDHIGYGVFAEDDIEKDQLVGEYTGIIMYTKDIATSKYSWNYPLKKDKTGKDVRISLDANDAGNEMRFVNHDYSPNAVVTMVPQADIWHMVYVANKPIKKGQQVLTSYGKGYWSKRGEPFKFVKDDGSQVDPTKK